MTGLTVEQAKAVLGLEGPADARAVKRAYLRKVKLVRPERDPEGFQLVRRAFELLEHGDTFEVSSAAQLESPHSTLPQSPPEHAEVDARPDDSVHTVFMRAQSSYQRWDLADAEAALHQVLESISNSLEDDAVPDGLAFNVGLGLMQVGEIQRGIALIRRWQYVDQGRRRFGVDPYVEALTDELIDVAHRLPSQFVGLLAAGIRLGGVQSVLPLIYELTSAEPEMARTTRAVILHRPYLNGMFGGFINPPSELDAWAKRNRRLVIAIAVVLALVGMLKELWSAGHLDFVYAWLR